MRQARRGAAYRNVTSVRPPSSAPPPGALESPRCPAYAENALSDQFARTRIPARDPALNKPLTSWRNFLLSKSANHRNMRLVVNQPKGGDPVSHCLQPCMIDKAWVIVPAKEFRA